MKIHSQFSNLFRYSHCIKVLLLIFAFWTGPAFAQELVYAYVANFGSNTVSVIDTTSDTIVKTIPVGRGPTGVALTPDGAFAYVANYNDGTVSVINTSSGKVVGNPIQVGNQPLFVTISPNGASVYVTNYVDGSVSVISTATNTVTGPRISIYDNYDLNPIQVAITPNGEFAYVTAYFSDYIYVISTSSNTVVDYFSIGTEYSSGIAITPDGATAYVTNYYGVVYPINTSNNSVGSSITVGSFNAYTLGIAITPNGEFAYAANNDSDTVAVINTSNNTVVGSPISVGNEPYMVAVTPDGSFVYVTNYDSNSVSVISTGSNTVVETISVGSNPSQIAIGIIPPPPAASFTGEVLKQRFLTQTNRIHQLRWTASVGPTVIGYNLYRNGTLIYTVDVSGSFLYNDNNRHSNIPDTYQLTTFNDSHMESTALTVTLQ